MQTFMKNVSIFYLTQQQKWEQYSKATLTLQSKQATKNIIIHLEKQPQPQKLSILPLKQILRQQDKSIAIGMQIITECQRLQDEIICLNIPEWNKVICFSFIDVDYCQLVMEQIQFSIGCGSQGINQDMMEFVLSEMKQNLQILDWIFQTKDKTREIFHHMIKAKTDRKEQVKIFKIVKQVFLRANKKTIQMFLQDEFYQKVLQCLSYNHEFGDRRVDYSNHFKQSCLGFNILEIEDKQIIHLYNKIIKAQYWRDVAICMFIQFRTEFALNEIIADCSTIILEKFPHIFKIQQKLKSISSEKPITFVEIFIELWSLFKSIIEDQSNKHCKKQFYDWFIKNHLLDSTFNSIIKVTKMSFDLRIFQRWFQTLNPLLSYEWQHGQQMLLQQFSSNKTHLADIILEINKIGDYNTKCFSLIFSKFLIEVTDLRRYMKPKFISFIFDNLISKLPFYYSTVEQTQHFINFICTCYQINPLRTRRSLLESNYLLQVNTRINSLSHNKYLLMAFIKLLTCFIEIADQDIFKYIERHNIFANLKPKYQQINKKKQKGVLFSTFQSLKKILTQTSNPSPKQFATKMIFLD